MDWISKKIFPKFKQSKRNKHHSGAPYHDHGYDNLRARQPNYQWSPPPHHPPPHDYPPPIATATTTTLQSSCQPCQCQHYPYQHKNQHQYQYHHQYQNQNQNQHQHQHQNQHQHQQPQVQQQQLQQQQHHHHYQQQQQQQHHHHPQPQPTQLVCTHNPPVAAQCAYQLCTHPQSQQLQYPQPNQHIQPLSQQIQPVSQLIQPISQHQPPHQQHQLLHQQSQLSYQQHQLPHQQSQLSHQQHQLPHQQSQLSHQQHQLPHQQNQLSHQQHQLPHQQHQLHHQPLSASTLPVNGFARQEIGCHYANKQSILQDLLSASNQEKYQDHTYYNQNTQKFNSSSSTYENTRVCRSLTDDNTASGTSSHINLHRPPPPYHDPPSYETFMKLKMVRSQVIVS